MEAVEYAADIGVNHAWKEGKKHDICLGGDKGSLFVPKKDGTHLH